MRFMMLVIPKGYENVKPGTLPDPAAIAEMMKFNEEMQKAGILLSLDGLHPPAAGTRVTFGKGRKPVVSDGPFAESKELLGGYWMIDVKSKAEAVEWARRAPMMEGDVLEIRQVQEMEDFAKDESFRKSGLTDRFRDFEQKLERKA